MDLNNIVFLVVIGTSLTFVIGHPSDTRTSAVSTESDTEQLSWVRTYCNSLTIRDLKLLFVPNVYIFYF